MIYVYIGVKRLSAARGSQLREFIYQHLRELLHFFVRHGCHVKREGNINRVPADCAGEVSDSPIRLAPE